MWSVTVIYLLVFDAESFDCFAGFGDVVYLQAQLEHVIQRVDNIDVGNAKLLEVLPDNRPATQRLFAGNCIIQAWVKLFINHDDEIAVLVDVDCLKC